MKALAVVVVLLLAACTSDPGVNMLEGGAVGCGVGALAGGPVGCGIGAAVGGAAGVLNTPLYYDPYHYGY